MSFAMLLFGLATAEAAVQRHALVVSSSDGGVGLEPLRYSAQDAQRMHDTLVDVGGFEPANMTLLADPTRQELLAALLQAKHRTGPDTEDLFLFYYSGHADAQGLRLGDERVEFSELKTQVEQVDAELTLGILDACRSGAITQVKGTAMVDPFLGTALATEGEVWITASSQDESAQESDRIQGSFFTHHLVAGLRGAADNGDGVVTLSEAYAYAYTHTVEETQRTFAGTQTPMYDYKLSGSGELNLTHIGDSSSQLILAQGFGGRVLILDASDLSFVAQLTKAEQDRMVLALPPGDYLLRRRQSGGLYEIQVHLGQDSQFVIDERWGSDRWSGEHWSATQQELGSEKGAPPADAALWSPVEQGLPVEQGRPVEQAVPSGEQPAAHALPAAHDLPAAPAQPEPVSIRYLGPVQDVVAGKVPQVAQVSQSAVDMAQSNDWRHDPRMAAGASTLMAGGGQLYNGQYLKGAGYFVMTSALVGTGWGLSAADGPFFSGSLTGATPASLMGAAFWGLSISRAYTYEQGGRGERPRKGVALATETAWSGDPRTPATAGLSADWVLADGFSIGVDRAGWTRSSVGDSGTISLGGRVMVAKEWERLRPGVFVASGMRLDLGQDLQNPLRPVFGGGASLRWYLGERYFVGYELRYERDNGEGRVVNAGGLGVHLGG